MKLRDNTKPLPVLYSQKENCCGCSACYFTCPRNAICMLPDDEGFLYPFIRDKLCIGCGRCLAVCSFKEEQRKMGYL